jgi:hypothetical protein
MRKRKETKQNEEFSQDLERDEETGSNEKILRWGNKKLNKHNYLF